MKFYNIIIKYRLLYWYCIAAVTGFGGEFLGQ